jgi:hypothetical protein
VTRTALTLTLFACLSLWASGQDRAPIYKQIDQLEANRVLLNQLIDCGLNLSSAEKGEPVSRAEECRLAASHLVAALKTVRPDDAERVAELSDHVAAVVLDGLIPNLNAAHDNVGASREQLDKLVKISKHARADLSAFNKSLPSGGAFDRSASLDDARRKLDDARRKLDEIDDQINTPRK